MGDQRDGNHQGLLPQGDVHEGLALLEDVAKEHQTHGHVDDTGAPEPDLVQILVCCHDGGHCHGLGQHGRAHGHEEGHLVAVLILLLHGPEGGGGQGKAAEEHEDHQAVVEAQEVLKYRGEDGIQDAKNGGGDGGDTQHGA